MSPPTLTLNRGTPCRRCGFPLVWEWASMGSRIGGTHVSCTGPGDARDVNRALPQLSDDDRRYLLAMQEDGKPAPVPPIRLIDGQLAVVARAVHAAQCGCRDYGDPWTDEDQEPMETAKAIAWNLDHPKEPK